MPKAIIVDIDGTIADIKHRLHYLEKKDWDAFYANIVGDTLRKDIWDQILGLAEHPAPFGHMIIFVTSRPFSTYKTTVDWMKENGVDIDEHQMFMRGDDDKSPDTQIKDGIYETGIKPFFDVIAVFEDRPRLVRMYREKGLNVIDCGDGIEF